MRDPRYDILFEPVQIGPVTARNRFYQVPHCCGMGYRFPSSAAAMRGVKAEGGWAVVCTEEAEIHHSAEITPYLENRIWDDQDLPHLKAMTEAVHVQGGLAGIELVHNGQHAANHYSRAVPLGPSHRAVDNGAPVQARAMDKTDIANLRRWHRQAAIRAREAGFDIVYVYAGHDMAVLQHFLSRRHNERTDEYGGSLENRLRLTREILIDTKEAVGDRCGVAFRFAVDELLGEDGISAEGEGREVVERLAELPDLWDVNVSTWQNDSQTARFAEEGYQERYIGFVKSLTSKPVVGVGRYTSPDAMVRVVKQGIMDMIGAARPSIADPFLPKKIEEGRIDDIRECIGCNICVTGDEVSAPIRCTQNPTMGEEWRRGWHPEVIPAAKDRERVLIVGGGPAGLEAARACGQRGLEVVLAEASEAWGGRALHESRLPGLSSWGRVKDWRLGQLHKLANVEMYLASPLTAEDILSYGIAHVALATGATWRRDGIGLTRHQPLAGLDGAAVFTPDDFLGEGDGLDRLPAGPLVVYDDEGYFMGGVLAELLAKAGRAVTLVTPAALVSPWTDKTMEQAFVHRRLVEKGVTLRLGTLLKGRDGDALDLACAYTGAPARLDCAALVLVTSRLPRDGVYQDLKARESEWTEAGIESVQSIGDCHAPATIAAAVYAGHRYAREFGEVIDPDATPFKREVIQVD
ncbi:NAD(P)-binding protein [Pelagibius marinus]|uniref:oxidoreductase n=1 Tax=Pelagibius marinus TaxID=2762760 RepID=UPI0018730188|nr:NAD(P)-binding protein [Pelagibius marinus]